MPSSASPPSRKVRLPDGDSACVPDPLPPALTWTPALVGALSDADRLIGRLAGEGGRLPNPHLLIRPFVRREAVLSSRIEGTQATLGELLAVEAGIAVERSPADLREVGKCIAENPYCTVKRAAERLRVAFTTAQRAIDRLEAARVLRRVGPARRDRVYCATALLDILEEPASLTRREIG